MLKEIKTSRSHFFEDKQGRKQGEFKEWHDNGQLMEHSFYVNGLFHGEYKQWFEGGELSQHIFFKNGKRHGEYLSLWSNGDVHMRCIYDNNQVISFDDTLYPKTPEDRLYFTLKYNLPLLPVELVC